MATEINPWLGIDLGTCKTSAAISVGAELRPVNLGVSAYSTSPEMPTAVFFERGGRPLIGHQASRARLRDPARYLHQFKLDIDGAPGAKVLRAGNEGTVPWAEVVGAVLGHVRHVAEKDLNNGRPLTGAVLTVPAVYIPRQSAWKVMEDAAALAGFREVRIVREPHAAALYYDYLLRQDGQETSADGELTLVYDLGGGTFDPALIRRTDSGYRIERAEGRGVRCGGIFFDEQLRKDFRGKCPETVEALVPPSRDGDGNIPAEEMAQARRYSRGVIELEKFLLDCKHGFSQPGVTEFDEPAPPPSSCNYRISAAEFKVLIAPLLHSTIDCCESVLRTAGVAWSDLARVLLVGGSCSLPAVREKLQAALNRAGAVNVEICWQSIANSGRFIDPRFAVAFGAALAGNAESESETRSAASAPPPQAAQPAQPPLRTDYKPSPDPWEVFRRKAGSNKERG